MNDTTFVDTNVLVYAHDLDEHAVTRKIRRPIAKHDARRIVDAADVAAAFRIEDEALLGFWDALILASAARSGAVRLVTEDLNAGHVIAGVAIENPFAR